MIIGYALNERCAFSQTSFAKGVLIPALELANTWLNSTGLHLAATEASIITSMLGER